MYESYYGLNENPFSIRPDPAYLYLAKTHQIALGMLKRAINDRYGFSLISGDIGSGKTTLVRQLLDSIDSEITVGLLSNTHQAFGEVLQWILLAYGLEYKDKSKIECYETFINFLIEEYAAGRHTVLIIDEAQNLEPSTLEELRVIANINADKDQVLQLIFVGSQEIRDTLRLPKLAALAQRISVNYHLSSLNEEEMVEYVQHRLRVAGGDPDLFDASALHLIFKLSGGIPRVINTLCDAALVQSYIDEAGKVTWRAVTKVDQERKELTGIGCGHSI